MIEAALQWALEDGVPVFPVGVHKRPLVEGGCKSATLDESAIRAWWDEWPDAGIGGAMGEACGAWVLDIDLDKGGPASLTELEAEYGPLPATRRVRTGGGGLHLWFTMPERALKNRAGVRPGIDVRGTGGYVVLPPSRHESGRQYVLEDDRAPVEAPGWLLEIVAPIKRATEQPTAPPSKRPELGGSDDRRRLIGMVAASCDRIRAASEGTRNDTANLECFNLGGYLDAAGVSIDEVAPLLEAAIADAEQPIEIARRVLADGREHRRPMPPDSAEHQARQERWERSQRSSPRVPEPPIESLLEEAIPEASAAAQEEEPYIVLVGTSASTWYVRRPTSGYVAVAEKVLRVELQRLHPQLRTVVQYDDGPPKPMGPAALFERYGRRADELVYTYMGESAYRPGEDGGGTLVQRVCRLDPQLVPERSIEVETWLQHLSGDQYETVCHWLSTSLQTDTPTAALYFEGPNSSGKGLLADGLARCWGATVCDYADVAGLVSPFNSALRGSPVVWLDERAPSSRNGSAAFRRLTGNRKHVLTEKHRPNATLLGCPRLIIGSNGPDALRLGEHEELEQADEDAVALRIVHVQVPKEARGYLASKGGYAHTGRWVDDGARPGALPRHIAWLAAQRAAVPPSTGGRFLVEGSARDWLSNAARREGWPRRVLLALARAASGADMSLEVEARPVLYRSGEGWVRAEQLKRCWKLLTDEDRAPTDKALGEALGLLARSGDSDGKPERVTPHELGGKRAWVRRISGALVVSASEALGIGDPDAIRARYACK